MRKFISKLVDFYSKRIVSPKVILLIDLLIVLFSSIASQFVIYPFNLYKFTVSDIIFNSIALTIGALISFIILKSYRGIIRHTGINDGLKIILTILLNIFIVVAFQYFTIYVLKSNTFKSLNSAVYLVYDLMAIFLLISFRIAVKLIFKYFDEKSGKITKNVLIYGAGNAGQIAQEVLLKTENKEKSKVVAFIDSNKSLINKSINGIRVYSPEDLNDDFIKKNKIDEILFAIININPKEKTKILNDLIKFEHIKVKDIPPVSDWIDNSIDNNNINNLNIKEINIEDLLYREQIVLDNKQIKDFIDDKIIMITGAAGSIGSEIVRQLIYYNPKKLILVEHTENSLYELEQELIKIKPDLIDILEFQIANIANRAFMFKIFENYKPQIIFHAAAYKHVPMMEKNPFSAVNNNIFGTHIMATLAKEFKCEKFVMISTDKAVRPTNIMGATKRIAEYICQSLNNTPENETSFIVTRFGNVLGSNGSVVPLFKKQIKEGGPITVTHPDIVRYFMTIPEACQLVLQAGAIGKGGQIMLFDMGDPVYIKDMAENMIRLSGLVPYKDINIVYTGLRPGEKLVEELLMEEENIIETTNPKIKVAKFKEVDYDHVKILLEKLKFAFDSFDHMLLVKALKEMLPSYISNNSIYSQIDEELKNNKKTAN